MRLIQRINLCLLGWAGLTQPGINHLLCHMRICCVCVCLCLSVLSCTTIANPLSRHPPLNTQYNIMCFSKWQDGRYIIFILCIYYNTQHPHHSTKLKIPKMALALCMLRIDSHPTAVSVAHQPKYLSVLVMWNILTRFHPQMEHRL